MNVKTAIAGGAAIVVAVVLLIVLSSGGGDGKAKSDGGEVPTIEVSAEGKPVGGVRDLAYRKGDRIRFKVEIPFGEEVHLHGYDVAEETPEGGGTVTFDLPAEIEGVFEAELEHRGEQIVELTVEP